MYHLFATLIFTLILNATAQAQTNGHQLTSYDGPYVAPGDAIYNTQSGLDTEAQPSVSDIQPITPKQIEKDASNNSNPTPNNDIKSHDVSAPPVQGS